MISLEKEFFIDEKALPYIAFAAVFFIIVFTVNLVGRILINKYPEPMIGLADPYVGGLLALVRTTFMLSLVLWILDSLQLDMPTDWTDNSWVWPVVANFAPDTLRTVGKVIPFLSDVI
jgi:membrane protein required for colicin V production